MIFFALHRKKNQNRISGMHYSTGYTWGEIFEHVMNPRKGVISEHHPMRNIIKWLEMMVMQILLFSLYLYLVSKLTSEDMTGLEIVLQVFQDNTTIGWGNNSPVTWVRAIGEIIFAIIGIGLFGLLINAVVDVKSYVIEQRRGGNMANPFENETVIVNYPGANRLEEIIIQTRAKEPDTKFCIVDEVLDELPLSIAALGDVEFVRGSTVSRETLEQGARVHKQKVVVVFPKDRDSSDTDATTETIVKRIWKIGGNPHIIYYLVDEQNKDLFHGDFPAESERQPPKSVLLHTASLIVVQEMLNPGFSSYIQRLVRQDTGATPLVVDASGLHDYEWYYFVFQLMQWSKKMQTPVNALGMVSDGNINECPMATDKITGDTTILLSITNGFVWDDFLAWEADQPVEPI